MKAYHGTAAHKVLGMINSNRAGLWITESLELAARYANAQASGIVDENATELVKGAAVVEVEVDESQVNWTRRPASHDTLDVVEAHVQTFTVTAVHMVIDNYANTTWGNRKDGYINRGKAIEIIESQVPTAVKVLK